MEKPFLDFMEQKFGKQMQAMGCGICGEKTGEINTTFFVANLSEQYTSLGAHPECYTLIYPAIQSMQEKALSQYPHIGDRNKLLARFYGGLQVICKMQGCPTLKEYVEKHGIDKLKQLGDGMASAIK
jgi:hypothetical protein